jgi:hypothetical protein
MYLQPARKERNVRSSVSQSQLAGFFNHFGSVLHIFSNLHSFLFFFSDKHPMVSVGVVEEVEHPVPPIR